MLYSFKYLLALAVLGSVSAAPVPETDVTITAAGPVVHLGYGRYLGSSLSSGVYQWLGVPYATPPLGDLRWRAPIPPPTVTGLQQATSFKSICWGINTAAPSSTESEDCLYVDIWAPANATPNSKLPVWAFIQGGGYTVNSNYNYNGSTVVSQSGGNIVYVQLNYRVGAFGFLASENVSNDGDLNAGLLDQRLFLEWIQEHIKKFGGDPEHVVIHGDSAGAGSVAHHLIAYGGRNDNLFVGAIGESVFVPAQPYVSELEWQFDRFVTGVGCDTAYDQLACLRNQTTDVLQAQNVASPFPNATGNPLFYWTPTVDGDFLQDYPYRLFEQGKVIQVPIIFGDDTNEGSVFAVNAASPADISTFFVNNYPKLTPNDTDAINNVYPLEPPLPNHNAYFPSASAAYGETTFTCAGIYISLRQSQLLSSSQVWNYRYNVIDNNAAANGLGVQHIAEAPAIWGLGNVRDSLTSSYATYNAPIIPVIMDYWLSFIRDLNPNTYKSDAAPEWAPFGDAYDSGSRILIQTNATTMETIPDDQMQRCEFWWGLTDTMEQ